MVNIQQPCHFCKEMQPKIVCDGCFNVNLLTDTQEKLKQLHQLKVECNQDMSKIIELIESAEATITALEEHFG